MHYTIEYELETSITKPCTRYILQNTIRALISSYSMDSCTIAARISPVTLCRDCVIVVLYPIGSTGTQTFSDLPYRFQEFQITIEGVEESGSKILLNKRDVRLGK